ncbi:claudin-4-like [Gambusia affinis]|uniref:claudin-4-like n=1 Tax=Gambusia affinis TaxID=33528 RepID=UPI001CDC3269|nr:claudin-4-like [Gambusia affinis]
MASKAVQMVFVALSAIGLIGVIICCALPEWAVLHHDDDDMEIHEGLWKMCEKYRSGPQECGTYDDSLIPSELHAFRALTVISCLLGVLSLLLLFFGSDVIQCVQNRDTKTKMILAGGVGLLLAGLLVIIPVSWLSNNIRNLQTGQMRVLVGASIYIGYVAGLMLMLTGGVLCFLIRCGSSSSGGIISFFSNGA